VRTLIGRIESHVGRPAVVSTTRAHATSYRIDRPSALSPNQAIEAGFRFTQGLDDTLAELCG
jgi:hypothetical protein